MKQPDGIRYAMPSPPREDYDRTSRPVVRCRRNPGRHRGNAPTLFQSGLRRRRSGLELVRPLYGELLAVTGGRERILHYINTQRPIFTAPADLKQWIAELHLAKTAIYTRRLAEGRIPLRPGVARLIDEARRASLRLAIVTTTTPANVIALLEHSLHRDSPAGSR